MVATVDASGAASLFSVGAGPGSDDPPDAAYRLELRDAGGSVVASAVPAVTRTEDGAPSALLVGTVELPAAAAELVVKRGDEVIAQRRRSAHPPAARIGRPRIGRSVRLRWRATDADRDALTSSVDYSRDGGRTWTVLVSDATGTSATVPLRALAAAKRARLRVRVNDGFDTAMAMSAAFRAPGAPPQVRIAERSQPARARTDQLLLLEGSAFDDAGAKLTGGRLRWFAGRRLLGRGEQLSVVGLPPSTRRIRLVATDRLGRSAQASFPIRVSAARPRFLVFEAPASIGRTARTLPVRAATTVAATLHSGGRSFKLDRTPRRVRIPVRAGRGLVRVRYRLSAGGVATRGQIAVERVSP